MKIKICGLTREQDIDCVNSVRPDYAGFVFVPNTKRFVTAEHAAELISRLHPSVIPVGVFMNQPPEEIERCVDIAGLKAVQLHGAEDEDFIRSLRVRLDLCIVKAFRADDDKFSADKANASPADLVLIDGGAGDGRTFNWAKLAGINRQYFLAGGITPENASEAISVRPMPFALDVSSGAETDGVKDCGKITALIGIISNHLLKE